MKGAAMAALFAMGEFVLEQRRDLRHGDGRPMCKDFIGRARRIRKFGFMEPCRVP